MMIYGSLAFILVIFGDPEFGRRQQMKADTRRAFGRKERENVRDDSPYFTGSPTHWRAPYLAT
jgi:hypothetical protein